MIVHFAFLLSSVSVSECTSHNDALYIIFIVAVLRADLYSNDFLWGFLGARRSYLFFAYSFLL